VKLAEAVWFADITVTIGIYVPAGLVELAENASVPEGFVSVDEYFSWTPAGRGATATSALSLVDMIWIGTITAGPFLETTIVEIGKETEMGICVNIEPVAALPPPHPVKISANATKATFQVDILEKSAGRMITPLVASFSSPKAYQSAV
jgi:hypothetical protein